MNSFTDNPRDLLRAAGAVPENGGWLIVMRTNGEGRLLVDAGAGECRMEPVGDDARRASPATLASVALMSQSHAMFGVLLELATCSYASQAADVIDRARAQVKAICQHADRVAGQAA